jgi:ABC-type nitrate/sulfonate/bicarbonate transport system permease component
MRKLRNTGEKWFPAGLLLLLLTLWQLAVDFELVRRFILPSPTDIVSALFENLPVILSHTSVTLFEGMTGLVVAVIFSLLMAILMDESRLIKRAVYPLLVMSQTVPIIVIAPLIAMWFGFGIEPKIFIVVLVCFFPITISLIEGLQSVDYELIDLMRSMGASNFHIFTKIKLPYTLPNFFSGLKIAATYSIMGAVIGEWLGGKAGLGVYMERARHSFLLDRVFASIIVIIGISIVLFYGIEALQKIIMPWAKLKEEK